MWHCWNRKFVFRGPSNKKMCLKILVTIRIENLKVESLWKSKVGTVSKDNMYLNVCGTVRVENLVFKVLWHYENRTFIYV